MRVPRHLAVLWCVLLGVASGLNLLRSHNAPALSGSRSLHSDQAVSKATRALFQRFDLDGNAQQNETELGLYLRSVGQHARIDAIKMMRKADKNRNWAIDLKEFKDCVLPSGTCDGVPGGKVSDLKLMRLLKEKKAAAKLTTEDKFKAVVKTIRSNLPVQLEAVFNQYVTSAQVTLKNLEEIKSWFAEKDHTLEETVQMIRSKLPPEVNTAFERALKPAADFFNRM
mmetsp:Transcript_17309/g.39192  ORF Transcript_17309/g.39192 Transcript_17309/m.39192 type:complete len:226 (+) Transcript_17309:84-761(+)